MIFTALMRYKTHISRTKELYESNRLTIQNIGSLTRREYNEYIFDQGIKFIEEYYPPGTPFEKYYPSIAYDKAFWTWWLSEWKIQEQSLITWCRTNRFKLTLQLYYENMGSIFIDPHTEIAFQHNYAKTKNLPI